MGKVAEVILKDFTGAAGSFFGNARVPASIITGSSLGALFALGSFASSGNRTSIELTLIKVYRLLCWITFIFSLNVVITSTVATTSLLKGDFDPMAETGYLFLMRELPFEFLSVQLSLIYSILLFITVVTIRLLLEFDLLVATGRKDTGRFVLLTYVACTAHLISYVSSQDSLFQMTIDLVAIIFTKGIDGLSFFSILSLASFLGAGFFAIKSAIAKDSKSKED